MHLKLSVERLRFVTSKGLLTVNWKLLNYYLSHVTYVFQLQNSYFTRLKG